MKQRQVQWRLMSSLRRLLGCAGLASLLITAALLFQSCRDKEPALLTKVYGKVTDQAGQPIYGMTVIFAGGKGFSGGFPIDRTQTDSTGKYELRVKVPRKYLYASINLSFERPELLDKYLEFLVYEDGVQKATCCVVTIGEQNKYDFVLLPK